MGITKERLDAIRQAILTDDGHHMPWHSRLPEFEFIDEIKIDIVPRYKTSGLSGDEWRQHVRLIGKFKGVTVFEERVHGIDIACGMLFSFITKAADEGLPDAVLKREAECCDQPSCTNAPKNWYLLKRKHSRGNDISEDALKPEDRGYYRKFCNRHAERGDCCLNDTDSNYIPLIGGPGGSSMPDEDVSPSAGPVIIE